MDSLSMNQYEKQLYTVFKTFDVNDDEALDRSSIQALCDALQLEERGATLADALFEGRSGRVTFTQFRNGLLAVLGDSDEAPPVCGAPQPVNSSNAPLLSDDDSSGREVAPKFVFGSKKYGRRSRPRSTNDGPDETRSPRASSASRLETSEKQAARKVRCRRSASVMDAREDSWASDVERKKSATLPCDFDHDRLIDREEAYALCQGLHLNAVDSKLIDSIFANSVCSQTTVGDFFERLNISLSSSIEEVNNVKVIPSHEQKNNSRDSDKVSTELVLEALDGAGVPQARRLLCELGFTDEMVHPPDIEQALEDEIRALTEPLDECRDTRSFLLAAALAVGRLRLDMARQTAEVVSAERDKLRSDLAEANKRAGLLAQEVDESHARIENELKGNLKRMEARHAEALKVAASEHAAERDRGIQQRTRLEAELARHTDAENRLRAEVNSLRGRIEEAENRATAAEERTSLLELEQNRLIAELQVERERSGAAAESGRGANGELIAKVDELRTENKMLRDRNDELCAELEALTRQIQTASDEVDRRYAPQEGDLSTELHSIFQQGHSEECDSSPVSMDQKVLGYSEAACSLREIFNSIEALPSMGESCHCAATVAKIKERICDLCEAVVLPPSVVPGLFKDIEVQTEDSSCASTPDVEQLRRQLLESQSRHDDEQQKLTNLIKDLEVSLEQMKLEYDKCEEYWSHKMEEERAMFSEEQRLGDERLAELVARIGDYERQFAASANTLPTIDERLSLETQVNDLEDEFNNYKKEKQAELAEKEKEIARLKSIAEARERRPGPVTGGAAPGCACAALLERCRRLEACAGAGSASAAEVREMRLRTARAEAAVRRLQGRLAAADLLVKDLYVENCHLAHRTHI